MAKKTSGGWRLTITLPAIRAEVVAEALEALGCAVALKPAGRVRRVDAYGADVPDRAALAAALGVTDPKIEPLPAVDWAARLQKDFPPIRVGTFFVHGSHHRGKAPRGAVAIRIDAGAAFGTGGHESTRACLKALDELFGNSRAGLAGRPRAKKPRAGLAGRPRAEIRVLDMGTGSGILAIAAAKKGATVLAVDNDPQAVSVARENVADNDVAAQIRVERTDGYRGVSGSFDLVLANILARPVIRMAPALARRLAPGGIAVLAGFLTRDADRVARAQVAAGLQIAGRIEDGDWTALLVRRRAARRRRRSRASAGARPHGKRRGR